MQIKRGESCVETPTSLDTSNKHGLEQWVFLISSDNLKGLSPFQGLINQFYLFTNILFAVIAERNNHIETDLWK